MLIGILDDDNNFIQVLKKKLSHFGEHIYKVYNALSKDIFDEEFDIFFLDVMLEDQESFNFGEQFSQMKSTTLVYISSIDHFIYKSIRQDSFFFVRKSNLEEDLQEFFNKYNKLELKESEILNFKADGCIQCILQKDIIKIYSQKNTITIHTQDRDYTVYQTLTSIYESLNQDYFYRLNSYTIINFRYIKEVNSKEICLYNQESIMFSRDSKNKFLEAYVLYKRNILWG